MHDRAFSSGNVRFPRLECTIVHSELPIATEIGRRVREAREALGLRQDELALAASVSTRVVHQIESGKPTSRLDSIERVLGALGLRLQIRERALRAPADER
jgi:y4mF family transcriptional regulator